MIDLAPWVAPVTQRNLTMGLDITAYAKATLARAMSVIEYNNDDDARALVTAGGHCHLRQDKDSDWPQREGMPDGLYAVSVKRFRFEVGSYSEYNAWRKRLARLMLNLSDLQVWNAGDSLAGRPFVELINFSDCEGFIGPKTCAKLSADFAAYQAKADTGSAQFREYYGDWQKAFALASDGGVVKFH